MIEKELIEDGSVRRKMLKKNMKKESRMKGILHYVYIYIRMYLVS